MKKLVVLFALVGLFLVGCQDSGDVGIVGPDNSAKNTNSSASVSFLKMPASLEPRPLHKDMSFEITPQTGGHISYTESYMSATGMVTVDLDLRFPPNSVSETMTVIVDVSNDELTGEISLSFGPSPTTFLKPAYLTFKVTGLDPNSLPSDPKDITFVYFDNGIYVPMKAQLIKVDPSIGTLEVKEGEMPHFSRYGYAT